MQHAVPVFAVDQDKIQADMAVAKIGYLQFTDETNQAPEAIAGPLQGSAGSGKSGLRAFANL